MLEWEPKLILSCACIIPRSTFAIKDGYAHLENPYELQINALSPHSWFIPYDNVNKSIPDFPEDSTRSKYLNEKWDFAFFDSPLHVPLELLSPKGAANFSSAITVPGCWELSGFDQPQYLNFMYPFAVDPPYIPNHNPKGTLRIDVQGNLSAAGYLPHCIYHLVYTFLPSGELHCHLSFEPTNLMKRLPRLGVTTRLNQDYS